MERGSILMRNVKQEEFIWEKVGNIVEGRGDMGKDMPVLVYRLMQFTVLDVLSVAYDLEKANEYFRQAGFLAGCAFAANALNLKLEFAPFMEHLKEVLRNLKIGVLNVEYFNTDTGNFLITVAHDLDCSGLPDINKNVCIYDEGFIAGIFKVYTEMDYDVQEVDCWANGESICRFSGTLI